MSRYEGILEVANRQYGFRLALLSEAKDMTVSLDGKAYTFNRDKTIKILIKHYMDNPDMGSPEDFKSENQRKLKITSEIKKMALSDLKDQLELLYDEDDFSLSYLKRSKAIYSK